jgi:glycerophosphoryl diester phosphodiesterase
MFTREHREHREHCSVPGTVEQMEQVEHPKTSPLIVAHRGASAHAPENTLAAFRAAIAAGADGIEFDVQLAGDGVPVVIHDFDLKRTASRSGRVSDLTSRQIAEIDVGSWFNANRPKRAKPEFASETVPTLAQLLDLLGGFAGIIYIELKCDETNFKPLAAAVCDLIRSSPMLPRMIVKSFRLGAIPEVRHLLPEVQTAALFEPSIMTVLRRRKHIIAIAREFGADQVSLHRSLATPYLCALAAKAQMPVTVWTVDNPKWLGLCKKRGIGAVITNDPHRMIQARGK